MNWDAIGAVGEIIGAVGVIASVMYLALQIKKQTRESQMAAMRDLSHQLQENLERCRSRSKAGRLVGESGSWV